MAVVSQSRHILISLFYNMEGKASKGIKASAT